MAAGCARSTSNAKLERPFWLDSGIEPVAYQQSIPTGAFKFTMEPIPAREGIHSIGPFFIAATELTWEAFDCFVYRLDEAADDAADSSRNAGVDAVTRPSKPYLPPDRGFGHDGFAAISMSHRNAAAFCEWLSMHSGLRYRLPTEAEWEFACMAKDPVTVYDFYWSGDDYGISDASSLDELAWYAGNAGGVPHAVAGKLPNDWGLYDMHGNVAEWVDGRDGQPVVKGGSYRDAADDLKVLARKPVDRAWNASDPQIPKSKWWLADAPFIGFRVVCDMDADGKPAKHEPTIEQISNTQPAGERP